MLMLIWGCEINDGKVEQLSFPNSPNIPHAHSGMSLVDIRMKDKREGGRGRKLEGGREKVVVRGRVDDCETEMSVSEGG